MTVTIKIHKHRGNRWTVDAYNEESYDVFDWLTECFGEEDFEHGPWAQTWVDHDRTTFDITSAEIITMLKLKYTCEN